MTSLDKPAPEPSTATQDQAEDVIAPTPTTNVSTSAASVIEQASPEANFAPVASYAPATAAPYANGSPLHGRAPVGRIRGTGACIALTVITFGIYSIVWFYKVHSEMKNHTGGAGLGGGLAAVLAFFLGFVMPFVTSSEVGNLYHRAGMAAPVSGVTGLWYFPGAFIVIGPLVWFVKTNAAINSYWRSVGAS